MREMSRRIAFLDEIGLGPVWVSRYGGTELPEIVSDIALDAADDLAPSLAAAEMLTVVVSAVAAEVQSLASPVWFDEGAVTAMPTSHIAIQSAISPLAMDWPELRQTVSGCTACGLCGGRKNTVFGVGDNQAKWLFIGEGPGCTEDIQGEPFVGLAGKLLDNMLVAMGLKRGENAYITNIVKCRPTDSSGRDRQPTADEVVACFPYLQRQIELIQPMVLVALGKIAALSLLGLDPATPLSKLRGSVHRYADRPLIVTYHPAYLLRQPADKGKVWADLCLAMSAYTRLAPEAASDLPGKFPPTLE